MKHDAHMVDGATQQPTDVCPRQILNLPPLEYVTMLRGKSSQAFAKRVGRLTTLIPEEATLISGSASLTIGDDVAID